MDILRSVLDEKVIMELSRYYSNTYIENTNLHGGHNFIYLIKGDYEFVLRATPKSRRSSEDIESELDFMTYLKSNDVSLPAPLKGFDNKFIYETEIDGEVFIISAFEKANGLNAWERGLDGREIFVAAGQMLGKMHAASKKYIPQKVKPRKQWHENYHFIKAGEVFDKHRKDIKEAFENYMVKIKKLSCDKKTFGLIHGDYFFSNYFFNSDKKITILDFDECEYSWFISDIALCMYYFLLGPEPLELSKKSNEAINIFLWIIEGYNKENKLSAEQFEQIDCFFQMRDYILLSVIYENERFMEWENKFIEGAAERVIKNKKFVDVDFKDLYLNNGGTRHVSYRL
ncbi:MAG: phosphotransferase [Oscillospiraceae bacterium]|nr:phosphotransferase [Oscillospiraceae bacterium]